MSMMQTHHKDGATQLGSGLRNRHFIKICCAYDTQSAYDLEQAGFHALWINTVTLAACTLIQPDCQQATRKQNCATVRQITQSLSIPAIVDADIGFQDRKGTFDAVGDYGLAGALGICINDRMNAHSGSLYASTALSLSPIGDMLQKIKAVKLAADLFNMTVIARIESLLAGESLTEAIIRANAYGEAGADFVLMSAKSFSPLCDIALSGRLTKPLLIAPPVQGYASLEEMAFCNMAGVVLLHREAEQCQASHYAPLVKPFRPTALPKDFALDQAV